MAGREEQTRIALLVQRAGFGATQAELEHFYSLGIDGTLDELLHPERTPDQLDAILDSMKGHLVDLQNIEDVQTWWLYRMIRTPRPLLEKLTLFWHGHFAVGNSKVTNPLFMHRHLDTLRERALGSFRDMLLAVSRDPAMLLWLDGATNRKIAPNENYGRELLELYTLGIGHYTEDDVQASARAFTGWNLRDGEFFFNRNQHDLTPSTFLGTAATYDGGDIIDVVAKHPATAERITRKLFSFFAYPNPAPTVLAPIQQTYLSSGGDLRTTMATLLRSDAFYSDESRYGHIKSPVEFVVGAVRMTGADVRERGLVAALRDMGQEILNPPNVAGWFGGRSWVNSSTLLARFNFATRLASARGEPNDGGQVPLEQIFGTVEPGSLANPGSLVDRLCSALGGLQLSPDARTALTGYLAAPLVYPAYVTAAPNEQQTRLATDARLRGALQLALTTPDYQTA